jgi:hypothetical protein
MVHIAQQVEHSVVAREICGIVAHYAPSMKTNKIYQKINREFAKEQGFYDGRFKSKVIPNKKKEFSKKFCKLKIDY